jgi:hypothetical protein
VTGLTTDPGDPRLGHGSDDEPVPQNAVYLVLSESERAKGFVRPYRDTYRHVGPPGPEHELRDLTDDERNRYEKYEYVKYGPYEDCDHDHGSSIGRFWTQEQLDAVDKGCGTTTTMGRAIAETYSRSPSFYGATYCIYCSKHRPVGETGEFVWLDGTRVGT